MKNKLFNVALMCIGSAIMALGIRGLAVEEYKSLQNNRGCNCGCK